MGRAERSARVFALFGAVLPLVSAASLTLAIPPVKTSFAVEGQPITVTTTGTLSSVSKGLFAVKVSADLADLQQNITGVLRSQLDRSEACGERIAVQHATLAPAAPSSLLTAQLHYERWACAKAFGKQVTKRLVTGNGVVPVKLTPAVENNTVRLVPEIGTIEADGSLGELLRSPSFGEMLREKISKALVSAIQKGANLSATLPPAVQNFATVENAQFQDSGSGRLALTLGGEVRVSEEQVQLLVSQLKEHASPASVR